MIKISDAEYEVMKVIWKKKEVTSMEVIEEVKEFNWNFNTVRTLIKRLQVKGAIEVVSTEKRAYTYRAVIDQKDYVYQITKDLLKKLYHNSISEFVLEYCNGNATTADEIREVIRKVEEREAEETKKLQEAQNKK